MLNLIKLNFLKKLFKIGDRSNAEREQETLRNLKHQRYRIDILFVFTLVVLLLTLYFCWGIVSDPASDCDRVKSAFEIIKAIITGLVGFVMGKAIA